ncbi:MAG: histidine phosphotransferase [Caulobacteraceae bacterium]|nr:histidine phosphotransferase [Caulobacteraceae bacterium]
MSEAGARVSPVQPSEMPAEELAARLAARLCHDFISPASAIVSGLDLLDDPAAKDMRDEAMALIASSARKLTDLLQFSRVAFGASAAAESFDSAELQRLAQGVFAYGRAELDWAVGPQTLPKPAARAMLNLVQLAAGALPMGGTARVETRRRPQELLIRVEALGARVRLYPEVAEGLAGAPLGEGLPGRWVQAFYLFALVRGAGGQVLVKTGEQSLIMGVVLPEGPAPNGLGGAS